MTTVRRPVKALGLAALLAMGVTAPAFAAENPVVVSHEQEPGTITRTLTVDISDISLASASGRRELDSRITRASRKVCDYNGIYGLNQPVGYDACFKAARSDALSQASAVQTADAGTVIRVASR